MAEPGGICNKVTPAPQGVYQGAYLGDGVNINNASADNFAQLSGTDLDIAVKFMAFSTGLYFPTAEARAMAAKRGTLLIKLEPWSFRGKNDQSFSLQSIVSGKHDHLLRRFAQGAKAFGKPVLVSFAHEMNGNWYPWSGNPQLYVKAWRRVHQIVSSITCNVTWVWNNNIDFPSSAYYPGTQYVNWVAVDGYNWSGTRLPESIFGGALQYLKTLGKPMMIGEFGCAKNNTACLSNFVNFVADPKNNLKGFIYFNMDKEQKWAIRTAAEKLAYRTAIQKYRTLFAGSVQSGKLSDIQITPPTITGQGKMPPGFAKESLSPSALIDRNGGKIAGSQGRAGALQAELANAASSGYGYFKLKIPSIMTAIFGEKIIQWMLNRENGIPRNDLLKDSLGYLPSPYWKTKVAYLVISGNPDREQISYLQAFKFAPGRKLGTPLSRSERHTLLAEVLASYPLTPDKGSKQAYEGTDLLLRAEILIQLALTSPDENTAKTYYALANPVVDYMLQQFSTINKGNNPIRRMIRKRMSFMKGPVADTESEIKFYQGQARALKAQLILQQAGKIDDQKKVFAELGKAYNLLKAASLNLDGMHYLQAKRMAAGCLVQMGFIAKDLEGDPEISANGTALELRTWERENGRLSPRNYQSFFRAAAILTAGNASESVLDWIKAYYAKVPKAANRPAWIKQIEAYARIWKAKMEMVEAGEERNGRPDQYLAVQKGKIAKLETALRTISGLDPDILADVLSALAETLAQQGFIMLNLGSRAEAANFLALAKQTLEKAYKNASPQTKAEINLWLGKILYIEAGNKDTAAEKKKVLIEAENKISEALKTGLLHGPQLSYAYQTKGEIHMLQKKLKDALAALGEAVKKFPQNYGAHAVIADILSQQGKHDAAAVKYNWLKVKIANIYPHPTIAARIDLGLAEAAMRRNENYDKKSVAQLERIAPRILENEAYGSFLITRAINGLLEAYGANEDWHDKIIYIGHYLLGEKPKGGVLTKELEAALKPLTIIAKSYPRFKATLYLKLAEALIWRKKFDEAAKILIKADGMPKEIRVLIEGDKEELYPAYKLLVAELHMRRHKKAGAVLSAELETLIFKNSDPDPDLMARLLLDRVEGLSYEKKFPELIAQVKKDWAHLKTIKALFEIKGRTISYSKFELKLWLSLANAHSWLAGRLARRGKSGEAKDNYLASLRTLDDIDTTLAKVTVPAVKQLFQALVCLSRADIHAARWGQRDYRKAAKGYQDAILLLKGLDPLSKEGKTALASAYFGLAELYRYAKGFKNPSLSRENYKTALARADKIPELSEERNVLTAKIYIGWAKLEQQEGNNSLAYQYLQKARKIYRKITAPPEELAGALPRMMQEIEVPYIKAGLQLFNDTSSLEHRFTVGLQYPFWRDQFTIYGENNIDTRVDKWGRATVNSTYLGARFKPEKYLNKMLTLDLKFKAIAPTKDLRIEKARAGNVPLFFRRPDAAFSTGFWSKYFTAQFSGEWNLADHTLDTYYLNGMYNLGHLNNPYANLRIGPSLSIYNFYFYDSASGKLQVRERRSVNLEMNYELDLADVFRSLEYNQLKLLANASIPLYQFEREPKHDGMINDRLTHRAIMTGPFQLGLGLDWNTGPYGRFQLLVNGNLQKTTSFFYWSWIVGVNYTLRW